MARRYLAESTAPLAPQRLSTNIIAPQKTQPRMEITIERWKQAQEAERKQHILEFNYGVQHYKKSYENYAGMTQTKVTL